MEELVAVTEVHPAQQVVVTAEPPPCGPYYKLSLDALAEVLQEEGAQKFQDEFFE